MEGTLDSPANSVVAELNLGDLDDINAEELLRQTGAGLKFGPKGDASNGSSNKEHVFPPIYRPVTEHSTETQTASNTLWGSVRRVEISCLSWCRRTIS